MPTVVVVGRKNVGKSTIFNRLIAMRLSVVHKEPGVTRDRVYGEVLWRGRAFNLIDTGGFFPDEAPALATKITKQIGFALGEADLVYFVVDGKGGLKPGDEEICKQIRKLNKKIFLLVNKIDNPKDEMKTFEFHKFGFDNVFTVSAEAGIGFGDVLDETLTTLPELRKTIEDNEVKILILGRPNAGKSTLLNSLIKEERAIVDEKPGTTRDLVNAKFTYDGHLIEIIDTCGIKRLSRIKKPVEFYSMMRAVRVIDKADVVILIFDTTQGVVDQDRRIASLILSKAKGFVITPNKIDLIDKKEKLRIIPSTRQSFLFLEFVPIVPVSAKYGVGSDMLLNCVMDIYSERDKVVDKGVLRDMHKNLRQPAGGRFLNLRQIGRKPPVFKATLSTSVKENYIKYLRNSIRNYFGFSGVPILIKTQVTRRH